MKTALKKVFGISLAFILCLILWQLGAAALDKAFLPGPAKAFGAMFRLLKEGKLLKHFAVSSYRVLAAVICSFIPAAVFGLALGQSHRLDSIFGPLVHFLYPVPKVVFLPVIVVLFGLGDFPKIFLIALVLFFQMLVVTRDAAKQISEEYILSSKALCMTNVQRWVHVYIPACLLQMITSLRVGIGTAIAILFFAESFASVTGLGYFISDALSRRSYDDMYAGILAMAILGILFYAVFSLIERRAGRWKRA